MDINIYSLILSFCQGKEIIMFGMTTKFNNTFADKIFYERFDERNKCFHSNDKKEQSRFFTDITYMNHALNYAGKYLTKNKKYKNKCLDLCKDIYGFVLNERYFINTAIKEILNQCDPDTIVFLIRHGFVTTIYKNVEASGVLSAHCLGYNTSSDCNINTFCDGAVESCHQYVLRNCQLTSNFMHYLFTMQELLKITAERVVKIIGAIVEQENNKEKFFVSDVASKKTIIHVANSILNHYIEHANNKSKRSYYENQSVIFNNKFKKMIPDYAIPEHYKFIHDVFAKN